MPEYKLIYFNMLGRGEFIRWLFSYGNIPFTDDRFKMQEWPARKQTIPSGQVPLLMIGEKMLPESLAIARYLAKETGLVPEDNMEAAYCDAAVDAMNDLVVAYYDLSWPKDTEEKTKKFIEEMIPKKINPMLTRLEKRLSDGREWFISGKITWADLKFAETLHLIMIKRPSLLEEFPNVGAHFNRVVNLPQIKAWLKDRPTHDEIWISC